jgi:uncharacterized membrane protein HdeD (DUF308 family)
MALGSFNPHLSQIWWVFLLKGLTGLILGFMLLTEPAATLVALTTLLGFYWLVLGVLSLVQVFVDRSIPWIWSLLTGIVGILAGHELPMRDLPCSSILRVAAATLGLA